ncbi:MAG TPA: 2-isopropylmalate synthase, partial [Buchnera sp. (in: enterobacteria)]|nr:2-isopropylmalate synthase [Buchnera sp. (in: enterobacteria)]
IAAQSMSFLDNFRIHIFLGTSNLHVKYKLKKHFSEIIDMAVRSVKRAQRYTDDIEFSCEDAGRTSIDNLCRIVEATINAGATTINIPDTVGYTMPNEFGNIIQSLYKKVPNIDQAVISIHCHDDLGMAVANSLIAIQTGARQVEGTINGIGERAGNTALEEIIMTIKIKENSLKLYTNINHQEIYRTSQIISQICNAPIPFNKAIVGSHAFAHSSGIHQDGILKNRANYEIIIPESIGVKENTLNLTSRSGRSVIKYYMKKMGYQNNEYNIDKLYNNFLQLADQKGQVFDYDLEILAFINQQKIPEYFCLKNFTITSNYSKLTTVSIELICGKHIKIVKVSTEHGPIDTIYQALKKIIVFPIFLQKIKLITEGQTIETLGKVDITILYKKRKFYGSSSNINILESFITAMIDIFNKIWRIEQIKKEKNTYLKNYNN